MLIVIALNRSLDMSHTVDVPSPPNPPSEDPASYARSHIITLRERITAALESRRSDLVILVFVLISLTLSATQMSITIFDPKHEIPGNLFVVSLLSALILIIVSLFLAELFLRLIAEGFSFLTEFAHIVDICVVVVAFSLQVFLGFPEKEVAGLLIAARFWRLTHLIDASHEARFRSGATKFENNEDKVAYLGEMLATQEEKNDQLAKELSDAIKERDELKSQLSIMLNSALQKKARDPHRPSTAGLGDP